MEAYATDRLWWWLSPPAWWVGVALANVIQLLRRVPPPDRSGVAEAIRGQRARRSGAPRLNDGRRAVTIWAPYIAHVRVFCPRVLPVERHAERELVLSSIGRLASSPEAYSAVCAPSVLYVFRGAGGTGWGPQRFASVSDPRAVELLEQVFACGGAALHGLHCPA
jgi:hypothetical protein